MLLAAVFVISMVIFMMRTARKLKGEIESKVGTLAGAGSKWGLFAFIFLMVFREGIETVAILAGVSLNSTELMSFLGTLSGVALAVVFGVMFVKGSVRIDLRKFFKVTTVILFFVAAQLIISGFHELSESGVLPSSKREMAVIGPIVRNDFFFPVSMLALVVMMILLEYRRRKPEAAPAARTRPRNASRSGLQGGSAAGRLLSASRRLFLLPRLRPRSSTPRGRPRFRRPHRFLLMPRARPRSRSRICNRVTCSATAPT